MDDALAVGATAIVGITSGFAELGDEGRAAQTAVAAKIRDAGAVLLGPNCLGVLDTTSDLYLVSNPLPHGPVGLVSQSGNMALELSKFLADRGLGFSRFASLGNQADLGAADLIRAYAHHPAPRSSPRTARTSRTDGLSSRPPARPSPPANPWCC